VGEQKASRLSKAAAGHYKKAGVAAGRGLWEIRLDENEGADLQTGSEIKVEVFDGVKAVDVTGVSKGKGTAGVIKRWGFGGGRATHGNSLSHRSPGSIGQRQSPGRVFKGKKMAGHMGSDRVTALNLDLVRIDTERNLLLVKGAVPGATNGDVIVRPTVKA
jgi:large subunit ribosomal protein L3